MRELSKAEEMYLISIWHLKENAYGVTIRDKISELTGKVYTYGTLYAILDQLVHRGYAVKKEGEPTSERGGRRKLFYNLTQAGFTALKKSFLVQKTLWKDIDLNTFEGDYGIEG
ncbi:PadR family transcriptional regulator [candidate division KSB1 bacterium]